MKLAAPCRDPAHAILEVDGGWSALRALLDSPGGSHDLGLGDEMTQDPSKLTRTLRLACEGKWERMPTMLGESADEGQQIAGYRGGALTGGPCVPLLKVEIPEARTMTCKR